MLQLFLADFPVCFELRYHFLAVFCADPCYVSAFRMHFLVNE